MKTRIYFCYSVVKKRYKKKCAKGLSKRPKSIKKVTNQGKTGL